MKVVIDNIINVLISNIKLIEKGMLGIEGSYVELITLIGLIGLAILPILSPKKHREVYRHINQILAVFVFIFLVFTCLGTFGMIHNFFKGLREIGKENILVLYFCSVPVIIFVMSIFAGPIFCGWICPTGAIQEFFNFIGTKIFKPLKKIELAQKKSFSLKIFIVAVISLAILIAWLIYLSFTKVFFVEDSVIYWSVVLVLLLFILSFKINVWDKKLRRLKYISFAVILSGALMNMKISSPVHFAFAKVNDTSSLLSTVMVVMATVVISRIWCRYLCPWRCIISWAGKKSVRSIQFDSNRCTSCGICDTKCDLDAVENGNIDLNECHMCLRCVDNCPTKALKINENWKRN